MVRARLSDLPTPNIPMLLSQISELVVSGAS